MARVLAPTARSSAELGLYYAAGDLARPFEEPLTFSLGVDVEEDLEEIVGSIGCKVGQSPSGGNGLRHVDVLLLPETGGADVFCESGKFEFCYLILLWTFVHPLDAPFQAEQGNIVVCFRPAVLGMDGYLGYLIVCGISIVVVFE